MTAPTNDPEFNDLDDARSDLREGLANSRAIVRQSRLLIELSESDSALPANDDLGPIAN
ncbi:hypothetical protein [Sphingomonas alba]|uniref:Uncharacterized protein n=1 Tax=Sphingomonas alba TaxID=2908208 RepID=A0ABT0RLE3_9SPHN|nr:hypothetical protein [Sphingomonas alba]MCL6683472.1 hypothetical protein [Sphingomonas alba]